MMISPVSFSAEQFGKSKWRGLNVKSSSSGGGGKGSSRKLKAMKAFLGAQKAARRGNEAASTQRWLVQHGYKKPYS